jgi:membrane-associated PAP2 superfamily phosphatase
MRRTTFIDLLLPLAILAAFTVFFRATDRDLDWERRFYSAPEGWSLARPQPWRFFYEWGPAPAILLGTGGLVVFFAGLRDPRRARRRAAGLYLALALIAGPGLLVNALLKDHWGRPRPRDLVEFGGSEEYWEVLERRPGGTGHSFPSGHASSGFFLFAPFFLVRRRSRRWAAAFLAIGLSYGLLLGIARMGQGAHFASDVVWAWGVTYFVALALARALRIEDGQRPGGRLRVEPRDGGGAPEAGRDRSSLDGATFLLQINVDPPIGASRVRDNEFPVIHGGAR